MNRWIALAGFIALCLITGAVGGYVTAGSVGTWFPTLVKPSFNPPSWVFGPVWTVLYILMGIAAWLVWQRGGRGALVWFYVQLALNFLWSLLFFGLQSPGLALIDIVLLWLAIAVTLWQFSRSSGLAAALMAPYLAWVSFAMILNAAIWWLN